MKKPTKEFIVWISNGNGQYVPYFFHSEEEAILHEKYTDDWYITRAYNHISSIYLFFDKTHKEPELIP